MIKILNSNFERQAILKQAINPNRFEEINGENTLTFSAILDEKTSEYINENAVIELDDDYFDIAYFQKNQNEDGTLTIDVETEHISYRLNNPEYNLEYFAATGTPSAILASLLNGTGFTVGTVEFSGNVTYSIQEEKSRRMMLMEFASLLGGELDFDKFEISILQHRGSTEPKILAKGKNIKIISKIFNKRETDENGNPLISYTCTPIMLPDAPLELGDEVLLIQKDLDIKEQLRIVRIGYNPYNPVEVEIELANFVSGLEDDIYRIETSTVVKDKVYNGCRIGPEEGFVAERSDGKAKTVMNATEGISIYSDIGYGLNKNFFVGLDGRIQAKGIDIDGSGTFAGNLSAAGGTFSGTLSGVDGTFSGTISASTIIGSTIIGGSLTVGTNYKLSITEQSLNGIINFSSLGGTSFASIGYNEYGLSIVSNTRIYQHADGVQIEGSNSLALASDGVIYSNAPDITLTALEKDIRLNTPYGKAYYNNSEISTRSWTSSNFASLGHNHGNNYVKSHTGQDLSLVATESGIVVRVNGVTLGSIFYD